MFCNVRKLFVTVCSLALVSLALAGCGGQVENGTSAGETKQKTQEPIKIGVVTAISGTYGVIGKEVLEGASFAADEVNAKGGILGRQVEIVAEDDEAKPDVGIRKVEKLATKDDVKFFIGTVSSAVGLAISAKMPELNAIYVSTVNKTPKLTGEMWNRNTFRSNHNDNEDMMMISKWLSTRKDLKEWYLVGADYEWGHSSVNSFKALAQANGAKFSGEVFIPLGTQDMSAQVAQVKGAKPQAVWTAVSGGDAINFIKQAKAFGLTEMTEIIGHNLIIDSAVKAAGENALGLMGNSNYHYSINTSENRDFVSAFEKKYGKKPTNYQGETYTGMLMIFNAISKAGTKDVEKVILAMEGLEFSSPYGLVKVRKEDHQLQTPNYLGKVVKGNGGPEVKIVLEVSKEETSVPLEKTGWKGAK